jgi:hypothetical protein
VHGVEDQLLGATTEPPDTAIARKIAMHCATARGGSVRDANANHRGAMFIPQVNANGSALPLPSSVLMSGVAEAITRRSYRTKESLIGGGFQILE